MLNKPAPYGPVTTRAAVSFVPAAGLGAALAALPHPWIVYRKGGFSSFDGAAGEIYGGIYIALHPEKGVALVDSTPAQPELAIPRLRTLFRQTGLAVFAGDEPPIVAVTLTRGETQALARRLADAFAAAPGCRIASAAWTEAAAEALAARFPYLKQVQRADATALVQGQGPEGAARPGIPASSPLARAEQGRRSSLRQTGRSGHSHRYGRAETPRFRYGGRAALGVVAVTAIGVAAFALWPRGGSAPTALIPPPPSANIDLVQPAQLEAPTPPTGAISPLTEQIDAVPPVPPEKPPVPRSATARPHRAVTPSTTAALPPAEPRTAKRKTAAPRPEKSAAAEQGTVYVPSEVAPRAVEPEAKKPPPASTPAAATQTELERRPVAEPLPPGTAPEDTITVDGVTYIKGREPKPLAADPNAPETASDEAVPANDKSAPEAAPPASAEMHAPAAATAILAPSSAVRAQGPSPYDEH